MLLRATADLLRVITTVGGASLKCTAWGVETDNATPPVVQDLPRTVTAFITTATTTTIFDCTTTNHRRRVLGVAIRNDHATVTETCEVIFSDGTTVESVIKVTLLPGESLRLNAAGTWLHYDTNGGIYGPTSPKLDAKLHVTSDVINATTAFADVTGLTVGLKSGKQYAFEAHLYHISNATTTGARFGVNIGATPTFLIIGTIDTVTGSVTAGVMSTGSVAALDTAATAQTTGSAAITLAILSGHIQPSADGTFAIRCQSEVAVAAGLTVKAGSWLRIWETDN